MYLICGLGNPGTSYAGHRHNIGFHAVDALCRAYGLQFAGSKFSSETFKGRITGQDVFALKPQTFMNRSGIAAGEAARFYKVPPSRLIVLHDELNLEPGRLKVKTGGGHGGHNGLKDIDRALGQDYVRVRLGIGHPGRKEMVTGYVLSDFSLPELDVQEPMLAAVTKHFPLLLQDAPEKFMNAVALDTQLPKPAR